MYICGINADSWDQSRNSGAGAIEVAIWILIEVCPSRVAPPLPDIRELLKGHEPFFESEHKHSMCEEIMRNPNLIIVHYANEIEAM